MSRAKQIGTTAESIVVAVAKRNGFPYAKRVTLNGAKDQGDVHLGDGISVIVEVKGGKQCLSLTPGKMDKWLTETECEKKNAGALIGFLVTQRKGYGIIGAEKWWAHFRSDDWDVLHNFILHPITEPYITIELGTALELIDLWHRASLLSRP